MLGASDVLGGAFTPHCAAVHPARLVRGLARVVEAAGVPIFERTPVRAIEPGRVRDRRRARCGPRSCCARPRATPPRLAGQRRAVAPVYSLMVATEPLTDAIWESIGLAERPTFSDGRHLIIYGQRTADGRLAFGGRGRAVPLRLADPGVVRRGAAGLRRPAQPCSASCSRSSRDVSVHPPWGGCLGIARDWSASVGLDRATGIGWAGGYVGDGVATTNLAGRTLGRPGHRRPTATSSRCPGSTTAAARGSPSRCAGWASTPGCAPCPWPTARSAGPGGTSRIARLMAPLTGGH